MEEKIVNTMKQLGFTLTEAKAYVGLLKNHPSTGYEIAARSGVPRSAIYNVLGRLESLGLVNAVQEKPAKYMPLSPERLYDLMQARFATNLEELKGAMKGLAHAAPDAATWSILGYRAMIEQATGLINNSSKIVFASLWHREAQGLAAALRSAAERGVEVILFSFNPVPDGIGYVLSYNIPEEKLEKYWEHKIILISDHARVLVGGATLGEENRAVVTEEKTLVEMALSNLVLDVTLFARRTGQNLEDMIAKLTQYRAPVDDLLKEAL